jgi:hypothetical protein
MGDFLKFEVKHIINALFHRIVCEKVDTCTVSSWPYR